MSLEYKKRYLTQIYHAAVKIWGTVSLAQSVKVFNNEDFY